MKTLAIATVLAVAGFAGAAHAAPVGTTVEVSATLPALCTFASPSQSVQLDNAKKSYLGTLSYTCNFDGTVYAYISADKGKLTSTTDSTNTVGYSLLFGDTAYPVEDWASAADFGPGGFANNVRSRDAVGLGVQAGSSHETNFGVALLQDLTKAGTYTDTITITVAP